MAMRKLEWDSEFFNKEIFAIDISESDLSEKDFLQISEVRNLTHGSCVYVFLPLITRNYKSSKDILANFYRYKESLAKGLSYKVVPADIKVEFAMVISETTRCPVSHSTLSVSPRILSARHGDSVSSYQKSCFEKLGWRAGHRSRFNLPPFNHEECKRLYSCWIEKSLSGLLADYVIFTETGDTPESILTLKIDKSTATIGLLAVSESSAGKGIGKALISSCIELCKSSGVEKLVVPTQLENTEACTFYEKCGFVPQNYTAVYHIF